MRKHCLLTLNGFKKSCYNKYLNALKERHKKQQGQLRGLFVLQSIMPYL